MFLWQASSKVPDFLKMIERNKLTIELIENNNWLEALRDALKSKDNRLIHAIFKQNNGDLLDYFLKNVPVDCVRKVSVQMTDNSFSILNLIQYARHLNHMEIYEQLVSHQESLVDGSRDALIAEINAANSPST